MSVGDGAFPFDDDVNSNLTVMSYDEADLDGEYIIAVSPMEYDIAAAELIYGGGDYKPDDDEYFFDLDDLNIPDDWGYYARSVLHDTSGYDTVKFIGENSGIELCSIMILEVTIAFGGKIRIIMMIKQG